MKKRNLLFITAAILTCLCTGCNSNATKDVQTTPIITEMPTPEPTIDPEIRTENIMGIYIGEQEAQIGLGLDTATLKEVLGKADKVTKNKKEKSQSWYYKDLDTTINFEKSGKVYTVSSIEGGKKAATLKTGGGITVGATKQDVLDAYQDLMTDGKSEKKEQIVIENNGYSQLVFTIEDDVVVGITMELL